MRSTSRGLGALATRAGGQYGVGGGQQATTGGGQLGWATGWQVITGTLLQTFFIVVQGTRTI